MSTIGHRAGVVRSTVSGIISDLESWGWLWADRQTRAGKRPGRPAAYTLMIPTERPPNRVTRRRTATDVTDGAAESDVGAERVADSDTHVSSVATPVSQNTTPRAANGDTRDLGTRERCAPTKRSDRSKSSAEPRWLNLVARIQDHPIGKEVKGHDRRLFADAICGKHGLGVEADTVQAILDSALDALSEPSTKPETAFAEAMRITVGELFDYRRQHYERTYPTRTSP